MAAQHSVERFGAAASAFIDEKILLPHMRSNFCATKVFKLPPQQWHMQAVPLVPLVVVRHFMNKSKTCGILIVVDDRPVHCGTVPEEHATKCDTAFP